MSEDMKDYIGLGRLLDLPKYPGLQGQAAAQQATAYQPEAPSPVHVQAWRRERSARFGQVDVHVCCAEDGTLQSVRLGGGLWTQAELKPLIGFLQELVK